MHFQERSKKRRKTYTKFPGNISHDCSGLRDKATIYLKTRQLFLWYCCKTDIKFLGCLYTAFFSVMKRPSYLKENVIFLP